MASSMNENSAAFTAAWLLSCCVNALHHRFNRWLLSKKWCYGQSCCLWRTCNQQPQQRSIYAKRECNCCRTNQRRPWCVTVAAPSRVAVRCAREGWLLCAVPIVKLSCCCYSPIANGPACCFLLSCICRATHQAGDQPTGPLHFHWLYLSSRQLLLLLPQFQAVALPRMQHCRLL